MMLRPFNSLVVMLLMLAIGIGLGTLIMTGNRSNANAAADTLPLSAAPTGSVDIRPAQHTEAQPLSEPHPNDQYVAVIFAGQSADIVARSDGKLEEVYVSLGDDLEAGDVVARIESSSIIQQLEIAGASLQSAHAEERSAEVALKDAESRQVRRKALVEAGLISKEEWETATVQAERAATVLEVARARIAEQMVRVKQSKESLDHTIIKATFEGTVAAEYLDAGATVHSGTPIISLLRSKDLWVRFAIPETKHTTLPIGSTINFSIEGLNIVIPAVIGRVSPGVAAISQDLIIEARLKVPDALSRQIKPGGSGLVSLATPSQ